jgi:hypothetical protein
MNNPAGAGSKAGAVSNNAGAVLRRWYVALFVLAMMVTPILEADKATGVYWSMADVVFYPPGTAAGGNPLRSDSRDIVYYAALVEKLVDGQEHNPLSDTTGARLYGTGIRNGYSVYLPNVGGQWQTEFNRAAITVEVVAETEHDVRRVLAGLVERIQKTAAERQAVMGVIPRAFITTSLSPGIAEVHYQPAEPARAAGSLVLLAAGLAVTAAVFTDNAISFRASHRRREPLGKELAAVPAP